MTTPPEGPADDPAGAGSSRWHGENQPSWQHGYGEQGYWQQQPGPPQGAPPPVGYGYAVPEHPQATTSMVLGIIGVVVCQVLAPFALFMGKRALTEIDASGGRLAGRGQAQAGYVLGIVGTVILGLAVLGLIAYFVMFLVLVGGVAATG